MFKTNEYYLEQIVQNLDYIEKHMLGKTQKDLEGNELLSDSMVFRLIQISEIGKQLTEDYKYSHEEIPWSDMTALRNRLVHDYGNVDMSIVYQTLAYDIPELNEKIKTLL